MKPYNSKILNRMGQKFGEWTIIGFLPRTPKNTMVLAECRCGAQRPHQLNNLVNGLTFSCGCAGKGELDISICNRPLYRSWVEIKKRCNNPNFKSYKYYGGRGIRMDISWENSFEKFKNDLFPSYKKGYSLDRINNDGNYEPGNVRWSTQKEQMRNTRKSVFVEYNGVKLNLVKICEDLEARVHLVATRIRRFHWGIVDSLSTPSKKLKKGWRPSRSREEVVSYLNEITNPSPS